MANDPQYEKLNLHRSHIYNNISSAYRYMARRGGDKQRANFMAKAKTALIRAIESAHKKVYWTYGP